MAEKSYFFNDINGDRTYLAEDFAMFFSSLIANGIFPDPSTNLQVMVNEETPMTITIPPGKAWVNGYLYRNPDYLVKTLEPAYTNPRIDRIVARWSSNIRDIKSYVITGTPSATPVAPELTRNSDIYEICLADIFIGGSVTAITEQNITDNRLNDGLCGIVHGLIEQVDTTTIFNQFQSWFLETKNQAGTDIEQMEENFETAFNLWFSNIQTVFSGDVAGNLLNLININAANIATNKDKIATGTITSSWTGTAVPYTKIISNANVTATNTVELSLASTATEAETLAWDDLNLKDGGQTTGSFTLKCWGTPNLINIPIVVSVRGA